ncbi:MAG: type II toxin-antitoxin system RelE/ParE family toxin [Acidobacteriota bacterium]
MDRSFREIVEFIALDNPNAERKLAVRIERQVERLEEPSPERGVRSRNSVVRVKTVDRASCRILYRLEKDNAYILHDLRF